jgi:hypothetical protein
MVFFAVCIFLSAFLLFQVQPLIAKIILPWFGGTPAVWSTVMVYFQVMLTGGYAYAHWLSGRSRRRESIHQVLLIISLILILVLGLTWKSPITPGEDLKPGGVFFPPWEIFKLLSISIGLPYFLLASNSPLIQAWFERAYPGRSVYRLYTLSNAGSLIALVTYPLLVEPYLTLPWQGRLWTLAYAAFAGLAAYGAIKAQGGQPDSGQDSDPAALHPGCYILWAALAATASILLLAVTSQITQEVAVIPFLWVLPLTIYLLTFILAFSGERWYSRQTFLLIFFIATLLTAWALVQSAAMSIWLQIGIYSLELFAACMICHGELYRLRPHPSRLTSFYLLISVGGALGGMVINFVAPYVFKGFWELPLGLALCWLLFLTVSLISRKASLRRGTFVANGVLLLTGVVVMSVLAYMYIYTDLTGDLYVQRNFYGVVRVRQHEFYSAIPIRVGSLDQDISSYHRYALVHGITIHGFQFHDELLRDLPTAYFGKTSGGGLAILNHPQRDRGMRVGVLGLGIGTLAAYGQTGDVYRFYEINPAVIQLAEGQGGYFTFLKDSPAHVEVVPGDARLSLEMELENGKPQGYDVLVLDVFSSDSIPVHLLDFESFAIYLQHLQPEGILAVHITNRHLNLTPVVWTLADAYGLSRVLVDDPGDGLLTYRSMWMLLARDPALLANPVIAAHSNAMEGYDPHLRMWTDDYNNLIQILK